MGKLGQNPQLPYTTINVSREQRDILKKMRDEKNSIRIKKWSLCYLNYGINKTPLASMKLLA